MESGGARPEFPVACHLSLLAGKRFVVLDRPNPVTGRSAQGPLLHREFATFVGRQPIAQAYGMTVAELARMFNGEFLSTPCPWRPY